MLLVIGIALLSMHLTAAVPSIPVQEQLSVNSFEKPWFYHDLDGPEYKVLNRTENYEERYYSTAKWATTSVNSILYSSAVMTGFKRLFGYIQGQNEANVTIPMTVPVKVEVIPGEGVFCQSSFKVSFYVPKWKWDDIPKPSDPKVFIETTKHATFYVTSYGGFAIDPILLVKAKSFVSLLADERKPINTKIFYSAGYDPPFRLTGRHNEIWVAKEDEDSNKAAH
jgi:hypothetical protein